MYGVRGVHVGELGTPHPHAHAHAHLACDGGTVLILYVVIGINYNTRVQHIVMSLLYILYY